jgi:hypothetical protein
VLAAQGQGQLSLRQDGPRGGLQRVQGAFDRAGRQIHVAAVAEGDLPEAPSQGQTPVLQDVGGCAHRLRTEAGAGPEAGGGIQGGAEERHMRPLGGPAPQEGLHASASRRKAGRAKAARWTSGV